MPTKLCSISCLGFNKILTSCLNVRSLIYQTGIIKSIGIGMDIGETCAAFIWCVNQNTKQLIVEMTADNAKGRGVGECNIQDDL